MAPDTATLLAGFLPFEHAPYFDFARPEVAQAQRDAFALVRRQHVGKTFPLLVGGQEAQGTDTFGVINPGDTRETVWHFQNASAGQLEQAMTSARDAFLSWRFSEPLQRATVFMRAAELLRARRMEFNAVMALENGKNWAEADGDRKSTRLNSSHRNTSRMPSSA